MLASLAMLLAGSLAACRRTISPGDSASLTTPATVTRGSLAQVVQVAGQVVAVNARTMTFGTVGGRVTEVLVHAGQQVKKGAALVRIDTVDQQRKLREAQADSKVTAAVLADAQRTATTAEVAKAEAELAVAEAARAAAEVDLAVAQQGGLQPLQEAVARAQAALRVAQDEQRQAQWTSNQTTIRKLEYDQAFFQRALRDLKPGQDPAELQKPLTAVERELTGARAARESALNSAQDAVDQAQQKLDQAQKDLARAQSGEEDPTTSARLALQQVVANVDKAKKRVDDLKTGVDSDQVKAAKTANDAAKARVDSAQAAIDASTLKAPFDGVVFMVYVGLDQYLQPSDQVLYLADPSDLQVLAEVTEMDVANLKVGQAVRLTFDAYPSKAFDGELLSLPVSGKDAGGVTSYAIVTSLKQGGSDIRSGMLANVYVVIGERQDVLTVPAAAVQYRSPTDAYVLLRAANGKAREQKVEIGLDDGILAEILSGLSEGQTVLVPLTPPLDPNQSGPGGVITAPVAPVQAVPASKG
jgi:HlyD family secretion protein